MNSVKIPKSLLKKWTKEDVQKKIESDNRWLYKAIDLLYSYQTPAERVSDSTKDENDRGFNKPDAHYMSYCHKYIKGHGELTGHHLEKARKIMRKYAGQVLKKIQENQKLYGVDLKKGEVS